MTNLVIKIEKNTFQINIFIKSFYDLIYWINTVQTLLLDVLHDAFIYYHHIHDRRTDPEHVDVREIFHLSSAPEPTMDTEHEPTPATDHIVTSQCIRPRARALFVNFVQ